MTTAEFVAVEPYLTHVPPEIFDKIIECLGHAPGCNCWADA